MPKLKSVVYGIALTSVIANVITKSNRIFEQVDRGPAAFIPVSVQSRRSDLSSSFLVQSSSQQQSSDNIPYEDTTAAMPSLKRDDDFISSRDCPRLRGKDGMWYVDTDIARKTEYLQSFRSRKFRRTHRPKEFLPEAKWAWKESKYNCPMNVVSLDGLCETLQTMMITRVFMVGDSLQNAMLKSLIGLLKLPMDNKEWTPSTRRVYINKTIACPSLEDFSFDIFLARENPYPNFKVTPTTETEMMFSHEFGGCGNYKNAAPTNIRDGMCPWHEIYKASNQRTLLLINAGAHYHSTENYATMMDGFVSLMERINRPNDIVMFRTTTPGHKDCFDLESFEHGRDGPFANYTEYAMKAKTTMYDWHLFEQYNEYVKKTSAALVSTRSPFQMHVLDVFNMTVLRFDGHTGQHDCLHYMNPGPVDWWNHLMYSNLVDMATEEVRLKSETKAAPSRL